MWSHYADSHKGVCLEFSGGPDSPFSKASPVTYQLQYPAGSIVATPRERLAELTSLTKALPWAYEEEWRMLHELPPGSRTFEM